MAEMTNLGKLEKILNSCFDKLKDESVAKTLRYHARITSTLDMIKRDYGMSLYDRYNEKYIDVLNYMIKKTLRD